MMKVFRAVGGDTSWSEASVFNPAAAAAGALYVTASEIEAVAWGLLLGKEKVVTLNVTTIRDRRTLMPITAWPEAVMGIEDVPMRESVILSSDILEED